uniref:TRP C-terminal domain-containing protein n=1 Tax=Amphimedon queenslandica TaxID=400682 RepID=A0A1X7UXK4_AMPQE
MKGALLLVFFHVYGTSVASLTGAETSTNNCSFNPSRWQQNNMFFGSHIRKNITKKSFMVVPLTCVSCNGEEDQLIASVCPYHRDIINVTLSSDTVWEDDALCKEFNRTGRLCSKCADDYKPSLSTYSGRCIREEECSNYYWLLFFAVETVPATLMYITFVAFNARLTSGYANGYILYAQVISFRLMSLEFINGWKSNFNDTKVKFIVGLYSVWSFQLGHLVLNSICTVKEAPQLMSVALQYTSVFYALLLAFIGYVVVELHSHQFCLIVWISKPFSWCLRFRNRSVDPKTVALNTLAVFYYMAFAKLAALSVLLLIPTSVYDETGHVIDHVSFYDGSMSFMKGGHLKYAILAIAVLIFLVFVPVLFMTFYQFRIIQKCLSKCHLNRSGLIIFMDSLQGCYKDGSDGGKDCRWFSSCYYFLRLILFILALYFVDDNQFIELHVCLLLAIVVTIIVILYLMPYKCSHYNKLDICIFSYGSFILAITSYQVSIYAPQPGDQNVGSKTRFLEIIICILISFPLIGATLYVLEKLLGMKIRFLYRWCKSHTSRDCYTQSLSLIEDTTSRSPLLRTVSGTSTGSLPDRMVQPEVYTVNSPGTVSPNYGSVP